MSGPFCGVQDVVPLEKLHLSRDGESPCILQEKIQLLRVGCCLNEHCFWVSETSPECSL